MYTLFTTPLSANGRKTVALSRHLALDPDVVDVNVYQGEGQRAEFLEINPSGKVPTLVDDDLTLWESNAILQYISEAYGEFRLWSREPGPRANIARWLFWESAHWQPALTSVIAQHVGHVLRPCRVGTRVLSLGTGQSPRGRLPLLRGSRTSGTSGPRCTSQHPCRTR